MHVCRGKYRAPKQNEVCGNSGSLVRVTSEREYSLEPEMSAPISAAFMKIPPPILAKRPIADTPRL
eukprot:6472443-Amphidinium_carterae.1